MNRIAKTVLSGFFKETQVSISRFLSIINNNQLKDQISYMYSGLLDLCNNNINNININSIKHFPKAKIFNFTILDYLKYNVFTNEILNSGYSGLNKQWNRLNCYLPNHDSIYVLLNKQLVHDLIQLHIAELNKEYLFLQRQINNKVIARIYGKFDNPGKLMNINNKIGDTIQLTNSAIIDVGTRDKLFVYCNGIWEDSNDEDYHSGLVDNILSKLADARYYYDHINGEKIYNVDDIIDFVKSTNERKSHNDHENYNDRNNKSIDNDKGELVLTILETKPLFFGNVADNIGYLISAKNITKKAAAELIKSHYQVKKVYFQQQNTYKYTRLAKKIL